MAAGFWQLDRLDARKASNEEIRTASESPALPVEDLLALVGAGQDVLDQTAVPPGRFLDEPGLLVRTAP